MSDEEISPERQNAINRSIDASDRQVIDSFARRKTESTEALVNTFTYFTMDDVKGAETKRLDFEKHKSINTLRIAGNFPEHLEEKSTVGQQVTNKNVDHTCLDEDGIEEEILEEGTKSGVMASAETIKLHSLKQPQRQFGNFVDEAISDDEGVDEDDETYTASFCQPESSGKKPLSTEEHQKIMDSLPHATEKAGECELSALVDSQYEEEEEEEDVAHLNPGEVEEVPEFIPSLSDLQQVTCLEITTTRDSSGETTVYAESLHCAVLSDDVEPFTLDEDFDYDNVKLTPKFTAEELTFLKSFLPTDTNLT